MQPKMAAKKACVYMMPTIAKKDLRQVSDGLVPSKSTLARRRAKTIRMATIGISLQVASASAKIWRSCFSAFAAVPTGSGSFLTKAAVEDEVVTGSVAFFSAGSSLVMLANSFFISRMKVIRMTA